MKTKIKVFLLIFTMLGLIYSACNKSEDLVTADAKTGGLIVPTGMIPYKLGLTPSLNIDIEVPQGDPIQTIHVSYYYMRMSDTTVSNTLKFDIAINGANENEAVKKTLPYTWETLRAGIVLPTDPQIPVTELDSTIANFIGDYWLFSYTVTMVDGREIINNNTTNVAIANFFAGTYDVHILYFHPTAGGTYPTVPYADDKYKKDLTPISAYDCTTWFGVWENNLTTIHIDAANNVTISFNRPDAVSGDPNDATKLNSYDPVTGVIQIYYFYPGAGGNRIFWETFTP